MEGVARRQGVGQNSAEIGKDDFEQKGKAGQYSVLQIRADV